MYCCSRCGTTYTLEEALRGGYLCRRCLLPLQLGSKPPPSHILLEIRPYIYDKVEPTVAEGLWGVLMRMAPVISAEIGADGTRGKRFYIRVLEDIKDSLVSQIQAAYPNALCELASPEDDFLLPPEGGKERVTALLRLERGEIYPLRTFKEGFDTDPIKLVLGGLAPAPGERVGMQVVCSPLPRGWADRWQGSLLTVEGKIQGESSLLGAMGVALSLGAIFLGLTFSLAFYLLKATLLALSSFFLSILLAIVAWKLREKFFLGGADPEAVKRKISLPACRAQVRLVAYADTKERARQLVLQAAAAFRQYDLAGGNAFRLQWAEFDPLDLSPGNDVLNTGELAAIWRLPAGEFQVPGLHWNLSKRPSPIPEAVSEGALVGTARIGLNTVKVCIPEAALSYNTFLQAKTQMGKTNLMLLLLRAYLERGWSVVFIDPHGIAVETALGYIPPERIPKTWLLDFSRQDRIVPLNFLDVHSQMWEPHKIVERTVRLGRLVWKDYWGPRMEDVWTHAVLTIVHLNTKLPEHAQFSLLDVPLLLQGKEFGTKVRDRLVTDVELASWWTNYWEALTNHPYFALEVSTPVLTKVQAWRRIPATRLSLGYPKLMVNFKEIIQQGGVLLVNLASGQLDIGVAETVGTLILNFLEGAFRELSTYSPGERPPCVVIVDESQRVPFDWQALMGELLKYGAVFVLGTQSINQMEEKMGREATAAIKGNIANIFLFQSSAEAAEALLGELDSGLRNPNSNLTPTDVVNLEPFSCYVKTVNGSAPLPVFYMRTLKAPDPDEKVKEAVLAARERYTISRQEAIRHWVEHNLKWGGQSFANALAARLSIFHGRTPEEILKMLEEGMRWTEEMEELLSSVDFPYEALTSDYLGPLPSGVLGRRKKLLKEGRDEQLP